MLHVRQVDYFFSWYFSQLSHNLCLSNEILCRKFMDASIKVILNPSFIFVSRPRLGHLMRRIARNKANKLLIMEIALKTSKCKSPVRSSWLLSLSSLSPSLIPFRCLHLPQDSVRVSGLLIRFDTCRIGKWVVFFTSSCQSSTKIQKWQTNSCYLATAYSILSHLEAL